MLTRARSLAVVMKYSSPNMSSRIVWLLHHRHQDTPDHQRSQASPVWIHGSATCGRWRGKVVRDSTFSFIHRHQCWGCCADWKKWNGYPQKGLTELACKPFVSQLWILGATDSVVTSPVMMFHSLAAETDTSDAEVLWVKHIITVLLTWHWVLFSRGRLWFIFSRLWLPKYLPIRFW